MAKDGIQVKYGPGSLFEAIWTVTSEAQEETVIARVGESIVSTIGSSENYKVVLENPNSITEKVLDRGLDQGTAFEILSIDIGTLIWARTAEPPCVLPKRRRQRSRSSSGGNQKSRRRCSRTGKQG